MANLSTLPYHLLCFFSLRATWSQASLLDLAIHAGCLHTLIPGHVNLINPSLWSLAVEVQLYALYPLISMSMARWGVNRTVSFLAALSLAWSLVLPAFCRQYWILNLPWRWGFEWILGVWVAENYGNAHRPYPRRNSLLLAGTLAAAVLLPSRFAALYAVLPPLIFALMVAWAAGWTPGPGARPLAVLGGISYSLYLVHQPIMDWMAAAFLSQA